VITDDEFRDEVLGWAYDLATDGGGPDALLDLGGALAPLEADRALVTEVEAIRGFRLGASRRADLPAHAVTSELLDKTEHSAAVALVTRWRQQLASTGQLPGTSYFLLSLAPSTPGLTNLVTDLTHKPASTPEDIAWLARVRAHVTTERQAAAHILTEAIEPSGDAHLAIDALERLDAGGLPNNETVECARSALTLGLDAARRDPHETGRWIPAAIGWAVVFGLQDLALELGDEFTRNEMPPFFPGGCRAGVVALALHLCGSDPGGAVARSEQQMGWASVGDRLVGGWVHAQTASTVGERLARLEQLGFPAAVDPATVQDSDDILSRYEASRSSMAVLYGALSHGRLPRLQARAWYDVAVACRELDLPTDLADLGVRYWYPRQDLPAEGHLWDPRELHRFTDLVRVTADEVESLGLVDVLPGAV
jgi:hypothetical protein